MTKSVPCLLTRVVAAMRPASLATLRAAALGNPLVLGNSLVLGSVRPAAGQVFGYPDDPRPDRCRSVLTPYLWAVNQSGTTTCGPFEISSDISFGDIWTDLEFGGSLHYVGMVGDWGFVLDAAYLHTGKDNVSRWQDGARADIGGFGVGSQFAFNSQAGLGFRLIRLLSIEAAFRYLYTDYQAGMVGTNDFPSGEDGPVRLPLRLELLALIRWRQ